MNVIGAALDELYRMFDILNRDKFDNALSEPVITIQKTHGKVLGHFTVDKVWRSRNKVVDDNTCVDNDDATARYEINIDPRWFSNRTAADVAETLLHEMCHYYNKLRMINDCNGNVHNKKFKNMAESVGLIVEKGKSVGWGYTSMSDELKQYIDDVVKPNAEAFEYFRASVAEIDKPKKPKTTFKFRCPTCGQEVKGKEDIVVMCGHCNEEMIIEEA